MSRPRLIEGKTLLSYFGQNSLLLNISVSKICWGDSDTPFYFFQCGVKTNEAQICSKEENVWKSEIHLSTSPKNNALFLLASLSPYKNWMQKRLFHTTNQKISGYKQQKLIPRKGICVTTRIVSSSFVPKRPPFELFHLKKCRILVFVLLWRLLVFSKKMKETHFTCKWSNLKGQGTKFFFAQNILFMKFFKCENTRKVRSILSDKTKFVFKFFNHTEKYTICWAQMSDKCRVKYPLKQKSARKGQVP